MEVSPRTPRGPESGTEREGSRQWNPRPSTSKEYRQVEASQERSEKEARKMKATVTTNKK